MELSNERIVVLGRYFINLTPHTITVYGVNNKVVDIPSEGDIRLKEDNSVVCYFTQGGADFPFYMTKYDLSTLLLPPDIPGTFYIVSKMVHDVVTRMFGRQDFCYPIDFVRDEDGKIIGCKGFSMGA